VLCEVSDDGTAAQSPTLVQDLAAAVAERERSAAVRWVWRSSALIYPGLLRAGVRVARCHDVELIEGLLAARAGVAGEPAEFTAPPVGLEYRSWRSVSPIRN
jgi:DNA polymerase-1